ncbi:hypothetical protein CIHG_00364 [Coccidioides immitis H538.4]|uniref:Uncharacterized protein n=2 Tax=Coccidioides immitis TaxID=5501 RepID=A0A0J8QI61_COCIT|nr:hypothetical protein CISG_00354 [Coccidioides immitis RMSCC 3703]KMU82583.1 hypothetical protein CIHG_00364 [Coccidioides immitis H538.4]
MQALYVRRNSRLPEALLHGGLSIACLREKEVVGVGALNWVNSGGSFDSSPRQTFATEEHRIMRSRKGQGQAKLPPLADPQRGLDLCGWRIASAAVAVVAASSRDAGC